MSFKILPGLAEVADHYDAFILDLWGVVHNGQEPYPGALDCMARLRESGRQVLLLSNAPRTHNHVIAFLEGIGVPADSYDHILTSGDMTRQALIQKDHLFIKDAGSRFYQIGALRDKGIDDGLEYSQVFDLKSADFIICTGLVEDETEDPEDYRALLSEALSFNLPMLCANPDLTVMRGPKTIYCAGAIAALYEQLGGRVVLFGKPYADAYFRSMEKLGVTDPARILAVGDSMRTDIKGANGKGIDCTLVGGGIHAEEWGLKPGAVPSAHQIEAIASLHGFEPTYVVGHMVW